MLKAAKKYLIILSSIFFVGGASQGSVTFELVPGNDSLTNITPLLDVAPTGLFQIGKIDVTDGGGQALTGNSFALTGTPGKSGDWHISGFDVYAVAIKAGPNFLLVDYSSMGPVSWGNWCTDASCLIGGLTPPIVPNGSGRGSADLSHLTLYGIESTPIVPEPATWLMMIIGFAVTAIAYRRRLRFA